MSLWLGQIDIRRHGRNRHRGAAVDETYLAANVMSLISRQSRPEESESVQEIIIVDIKGAVKIRVYTGLRPTCA